MYIAIIIGLVLLNGLFAMSEIALVTARKARLSAAAGAGDRGAAAALELGKEPTRFLSTVQIGITTIGILSGMFGEAALAGPLAERLQSLGLSPAAAGFAATAGVVVTVTYVSIVVGELVPKRLGQLRPEPVARLVARPMSWLALIARPFVFLLAASTNGLLRLLGAGQSQAGVTEEEILAVLEEGSSSGAIEEDERDLVRNVFKLDNRRLNSLMIPRSEVVYLDTGFSKEEILRRVLETEHSRFPVCRGGLDEIIGLAQAKHVLAGVVRGGQPDITGRLCPGIYVPETVSGLDLMERFKVENLKMAFVVDEYGHVVGIVTLQDLLEALTGEFTPADAADREAVRREDGSWLLDGSISVLDLKKYLHIKSLPEEGRETYHTLNGLVMLLLGRIPATGEYADWEGWRFEVADMDGKRIDKILAAPLRETPSGE